MRTVFGTSAIQIAASYLRRSVSLCSISFATWVMKLTRVKRIVLWNGSLIYTVKVDTNDNKEIKCFNLNIRSVRNKDLLKDLFLSGVTQPE